MVYDEKKLNWWRGKCRCGIRLTSNDMPFTDRCPYCGALIPYQPQGGAKMDEEEFFLRPVCRVEAESDAEATDKVLDALTSAGIEVRGWE